MQLPAVLAFAASVVPAGEVSRRGFCARGVKSPLRSLFHRRLGCRVSGHLWRIGPLDRIVRSVDARILLLLVSLVPLFRWRWILMMRGFLGYEDLLVGIWCRVFL